jgi:uncharacterized membrane protein
MKVGLAPIAGFAAFALALAATLVLYDRLPALTPVHWDIHGQVNGVVAKPWGPFITPLMIAGMASLAWVLPVISPKQFRIEPFAQAFDRIMLAVIALPALITASELAEALGAPPLIGRILPLSAGLMLIIIGDVLGKTTPNFFVGVRTPWTLASPEVWRRTHRLAGRFFVVAGLCFVVAGVVGAGVLIPIVVTLAAALAPVAYSYWLYRKLERD